jgi:hypothetical protein
LALLTVKGIGSSLHLLQFYGYYRGGAAGKNFEGGKINFSPGKKIRDKFDTALDTYAC